MHGTDGPFGFLDDGRVSNIENQSQAQGARQFGDTAVTEV
jgi:hypothetical protein